MKHSATNAIKPSVQKHGALRSRSKRSFEKSECELGDMAFAYGKVTHEVTGAGRFVCSVSLESRPPETVQIDVYGNQLQNGFIPALCSCAGFRPTQPCFHLWTALGQLETFLDDMGLSVPGEVPLKIILLDQKNDSTHVTPQPDRVATQPSKQLHDTTLPLTPLDTPKGQPTTGRQTATTGKPGSQWKRLLANVDRSVRRGKQDSTSRTSARRHVDPTMRQLIFAICLEDRLKKDVLQLRTYQSVRKKNGEWGTPQKRHLSLYDIRDLANGLDAEVLSVLQKGVAGNTYGYRYGEAADVYSVPVNLGGQILERLADAGKLVWSLSSGMHLQDATTLSWDGLGPWQCRIRLNLGDNPKRSQIGVHGELFRGDVVVPQHEVVSTYDNGFVLFRDRIGRIAPEHSAWYYSIQRMGNVIIPAEDLDDFLSTIANLDSSPELFLDEQLQVPTLSIPPLPKLVLESPEPRMSILSARAIAKYNGVEVEMAKPGASIWDVESRKMIRRDHEAETRLLEELGQHNSELDPNYVASPDPTLSIPIPLAPKLIRTLVERQWEVVAQGRIVRAPGKFDVRISSNVDWFDLHAEVDFGGVSASLPSLLRALKQSAAYVVLDDGTHGMLPEAWLEKYAQIANLGQSEGDEIRFHRSQALLLDAMLAEQADVNLDVDFSRLCEKLKRFDGIAASREPRGFQGELRTYQREGLGWLHFLRDFEFGGCLADDMGLGKTVQVLALLQSRRMRRLKKDEVRRPSIAIVPKSLIFNWMDEAERFAPRLRFVNYTGGLRSEALRQAGDYDLLITTYGTLRRDIEELTKLSFDYAILDEAQAIKNSLSDTAKACRLLTAQHRLAMTGTPVENHVGELWSLFDFLNPGMLGLSTNFRTLGRSGKTTDDGRAEDLETLKQLSNAIRPFVLRRTKEQVLKELPAKSEQTLYCEMEPKQLRKYRELQSHYRAHLSKKVDEVGIKRSKIHVLEALLRLRQAACDPRLIDPKAAPGAKVACLINQLEEILAEGHKALVFSQFTSLLALVRDELMVRKWDFEYLDGKTRDRGRRVKRFQQDSECQLFLISLKAGGNGLNLTAADFVFILDPWWNPAVEAQAIDRAHRMGQTKPVMAYRIICRNSVEDKIVELQKSKRALADAIITANESLISELSFEDIQMLLT